MHAEKFSSSKTGFYARPRAGKKRPLRVAGFNGRRQNGIGSQINHTGHEEILTHTLCTKFTFFSLQLIFQKRLVQLYGQKRSRKDHAKIAHKSLVNHFSLSLCNDQNSNFLSLFSSGSSSRSSLLIGIAGGMHAVSA